MQIFLGRKGYRMQHEIKPAPFLFDALEHGFQLAVVLHVAGHKNAAL
jgi:hypothetical protein